MAALPSSGSGEHDAQPETDRPLQPAPGGSRPADPDAGPCPAPSCARCQYDLTGSRQSERCPECGWQIDRDLAFRASTPAGPPRWAVASLLVCVISVLHFLLTYSLSLALFAADMSGLAVSDGRGLTPAQADSMHNMGLLLNRCVQVLMFPISMLAPARMGIEYVFVSSVIWGLILTSLVIGLYDWRKRRRARDK